MTGGRNFRLARVRRSRHLFTCGVAADQSVWAVTVIIGRYWTGPSKHTELLQKLDGAEERDYVGPLGTSGLTAYFVSPLSGRVCMIGRWLMRYTVGLWGGTCRG